MSPQKRWLASSRRVRFTESEWAVPRVVLPAAVRGVLALIERLHLPVTFPIEVRVAAPDDALLSTGYDRETGYVAVHQYVGAEWSAYFHAVAQAEVHRASLTILYVYNPEVEVAEEDRTYWRLQLESIRPTNPDIAVTHVMLEGDPAGEIVRYARDAGIDQIVIGTHGRTGVERLLMGSVAEKVMRDAPCSVLVVKLPKGSSAMAQPDVEVNARK